MDEINTRKKRNDGMEQHRKRHDAQKGNGNGQCEDAGGR